VDDIYTHLAEILEVDRIGADDVLSDFEYWDSLTVLSILAMLDSRYGVNLGASDIKGMKKAGELVAAVLSRRQK